MLSNGELLSHLSQLMSLHYLGKHEPGNCVFSVRHRHVSSPGECGCLSTEPVSYSMFKVTTLAFSHARSHIVQYINCSAATVNSDGAHLSGFVKIPIDPTVEFSYLSFLKK